MFSIIDLRDAIKKAGGNDEDYMVNVYHKQIESDDCYMDDDYGVDVYLERITGFEKDKYERACKKTDAYNEAERRSFIKKMETYKKRMKKYKEDMVEYEKKLAVYKEEMKEYEKINTAKEIAKLQSRLKKLKG